MSTRGGRFLEGVQQPEPADLESPDSRPETAPKARPLGRIFYASDSLAAAAALACER